MGNPSASQAMLRALFRSHLRLQQAFRAAEVPLVGVHGLEGLKGTCLGGSVSLAAEFRRPRSSVEATEAIDEGFSALRALRHQLRILKDADEEAQLGLIFWRDLLDSQRDEMRRIGENDALQHSLALSRMVEKASLQLTTLTAPHVFSLDDIINEKPSDEVMIQEAQGEMDNIANQVHSAAQTLGSELLSRTGEDFNDGVSQDTKLKIMAMNHVLYSELKFKALPVEWVYDGLSPLLLSEVIQKRSGIPLSLAMLHQAIATRLGLPCLLRPAATPKAGDPGIDSLRGATSIGPDPDVWFLSFPSLSRPDMPPTIIEPGKKGRIVSQEDSAKCFEQVEDAPSYEAKQLSDLVGVCAALARAVMVAHMRRGESEAVASWLYQLLALDPTANEWDSILLPREIGSKEPTGTAS